MISRQFFNLMFTASFLLTTSAFAQKTSEFAVKVTNTAAIATEEVPVKVEISKYAKQGLSFDEATFSVLDGKNEVPFQVLDENGDKNPDNLLFLAKFKEKESKSFVFKFDQKNKKLVPQVKRTQAELSHKEGGTWNNRKYEGGTFKNVDYLRVPAEHTDHSFFIRYEGPGWESDKVGYRFYLDWRNAIDIFGKTTPDMILQQVGQDGFESYHNKQAWGQDNFKVGKTLGLASIAQWSNNKAERVAKTDSVTCLIKTNGTLKSEIETKYYGWQVESTKCEVVSTIGVVAGDRICSMDLTINGTHGPFCTGLIKDSKAELLKSDKKGEWAYLATWGKQSLADDNLGIAVFYRTKDAVKVTEDALNHIVVLNPDNGHLKYYFLGAWEQELNGVAKTKAEFVAYLNKTLLLLNHPLTIEVKK
jgi:hypothetical protein